MFIIFDGCDNSGKSSIATELSKRIDYPYLKYSILNKENLDKKVVSHITLESSLFSIRILKLLEDPKIIIDRHYPSEFVYGNVFRKRTQEDLHKLKVIDREMAEIKNHLIIICYKTILKEKIEDFIDPEKYEMITNTYKDFTKFTKANYLLLDTTDEDLEKQLLIIRNKISDVRNGS